MAEISGRRRPKLPLRRASLELLAGLAGRPRSWPDFKSAGDLSAGTAYGHGDPPSTRTEL